MANQKNLSFLVDDNALRSKGCSSRKTPPGGHETEWDATDHCGSFRWGFQSHGAA
jgi:hypothetical protein